VATPGEIVVATLAVLAAGAAGAGIVLRAHRKREDEFSATHRDDVTQRVAAELELRRHQSLYRLLADHATDVVALLDASGKFTYVSPSSLSVLGYSFTELALTPWTTLIDPADHALVRDAVTAVRSRCPAAETLCFHRRDGTKIWLEVSATAVIDPEDHATRYRVTARDVTERRGALLALSDSEAKYRLLAESIDDIVCVQDLDGTATFYSSSVERVLGYAPRDLVGADVFDLMHPSDHDRIARDAHLAALRGERPFTEWRCRRKDGSYLWVESQTTILTDATGTADRLLSVVRNIEQRKRAEDALRASEERTRALIDRAAYGIFRCTRDGAFLDVNPAFVEMLGLASPTDLGQLPSPDDMYVDPRDRERWMALVESNRGVEWIDLAWKRKDGTRILVRLAARAVHDEEGRTVYFEGIVEDVTERLRREAVVRRAERMASLGHTLAGVAHEINNPLAAISGYAQILLKSPLGEREHGALDTVNREAKRAARIVRDLLTFARRQESGERQQADLLAIVRYIVETQRYAMETRGIHCNVTLQSAPAYMLADPAQIEQVVLNLVVNARQALETMMSASNSRPGGHLDRTPTIEVRSVLRDDSVILEIADNGPGIPSDRLPRIWEPFFTTKEEGEGTGLGLSVVHGIVGSHGGSIDVESMVGHGTTFTLMFPRYIAAPGPNDSDGEATSSSPIAAQAGQPLDLLVVDDEDVITALLVRYFSQRGHAVVAAVDGEQAIRLAERTAFDVVVCDLRMPGIDGTEVVRRLHALSTCANTRFVLSTGDMATPELRRVIDGLPISAVVDKPYDLEALRQIVEAR
jgi:PAS domain S-box-containing protein